MRALVQTGYGGESLLEFRDVDKPSPRPGQLLVQVIAAGLNPLDCKIREGKLRPVLPHRVPFVVGNELSGTVTALGEGVTRFAPGDRVFARVDKLALGAFAEYAAVEQDHVAKLPASLSFTSAAAVPLAGLTALQALRDEIKVTRGQRIFVSGGAGGVGTFAIQIAKALGAEVATTASPRGAALVRRLGADHVIDYTCEKFEDVLKDYDGVFDTVGGDTLERAFSIVKKDGLVLSIAGPPEPKSAADMSKGAGFAALFWAVSLPLRARAFTHGARYRFLFMHPSGTDLDELTKLIEASKVEVVVDRIFAFEAAKEALSYLDQGRAKGKVVLSMLSE